MINYFLIYIIVSYILYLIFIIYYAKTQLETEKEKNKIIISIGFILSPLILPIAFFILIKNLFKVR